MTRPQHFRQRDHQGVDLDTNIVLDGDLDSPVGTTSGTSLHDALNDIAGAIAGAGHSHTWNETPSGTIDGANDTFTIAAPPSPAGSLLLFKNGVLQRAGSGNDFTLSGSTVTFEAGNLPQTGDVLLASYTT